MKAGPIDHLFTLQRTPFALAPAIHRFYETAERKDRDVLLSYLVLPIVLYPASRTFLINSNSKSSLRTMCKEQRRLVGLAARVEQFKTLTNSAMLILSAERAIEIGEDLSVHSIRPVREENAKRDLVDASRKLAYIFSDADVVSIYRTLGLKTL
ncbi:three component ABC system middle component [Paraburkholderia domus]|uniref:three component ABC system middle component n=1 Tax=Paraburkholderia domus TaxID=2793075 RepID=UPI0019127CA0|nr:three component ABC system middle component [Paraburkholderia domus]MBK5052350.1 hypothetical protein [Burkholderia sp. R-70006]MBK5185907.1 hypothetical protein [Burkholderia sp. R-69749]CAE6807561.1 hypothetical protein R70006_05604 [Paraburkholderia domus]CAE6897172.1 hypothetical protein R69749_07943 [Paraburkholderia domus]